MTHHALCKNKNKNDALLPLLVEFIFNIHLFIVYIMSDCTYT